MTESVENENEKVCIIILQQLGYAINLHHIGVIENAINGLLLLLFSPTANAFGEEDLLLCHRECMDRGRSIECPIK